MPWKERSGGLWLGLRLLGGRVLSQHSHSLLRLRSMRPQQISEVLDALLREGDASPEKTNYKKLSPELTIKETAYQKNICRRFPEMGSLSFQWSLEIGRCSRILKLSFCSSKRGCFSRLMLSVFLHYLPVSQNNSVKRTEDTPFPSLTPIVFTSEFHQPCVTFISWNHDRQLHDQSVDK